MYKVTHEFLDKPSGKVYKVGEEYKGKDGAELAKSTKFRPALVVEEKAKAPAKKKEAEDNTLAVAEKAKK